MIKFFEDISLIDKDAIGNKAFNLSLLKKKRFNVPNGFVIYADEFEEFIAQNKLRTNISTLLNRIDYSDIASVETVSKDIQNSILHNTISKKQKNRIQKYFDSLKCQYVAVRSSSTVEDLSNASWAGQFSSFTNTINRTLFKNIRECWSSLYNPQAILYRYEKGLLARDISIAVIVQKMVQSDFSGIVFSNHPITGDKNTILIEAGYGLGEAFVSGRITPSSFTLSKSNFKIINRDIVKQQKSVQLNKNGSHYIEINNIDLDKSLNDRKIIEIAKQTVQIENIFNIPQDIEWAISKNTLYILQARPITVNLFSKVNPSQSVSVIDSFISQMNGQKMFSPVYNFTLFTGITGWTCNRYYDPYYDDRTNMPSLVIKNKNEGIFYLSQTKMENLSEEVFTKYWKNETFLKNRLKLFYSNISKIDSMYGKMNYDYINKLDVKKCLVLVKQINDLAWSTNGLGWFSLQYDKEIFKRSMKFIAYKFRPSNKFWEILETIYVEPFEKRRKKLIYKNLMNNNSLVYNAEYFQYAYANYEYIPTIKETIQYIKKECPEYKNPKKLKREYKLLIYDADLKRRKSLEGLNLKNRNEDKLFFYLQTITKIRDVLRDVISKTHTATFRAAEKLFNNKDIQRNLIYFSTLDEILNWGKNIRHYKNILIKRKEGVSFLMNYDGTSYQEFSDFSKNKNRLYSFYELSQGIKLSNNNQIIGNTGSQGKATGRAKIILNFNRDKNKFAEGDILVTGGTRPEYLPIMKNAAAIITDEGSYTSHAAIVSRELQIPCIINTKIATRRIKDNDLLEVDATLGIIKIIINTKKQLS